jgi:outer membrane murein-binding lipoprotein Lpp
MRLILLVLVVVLGIDAYAFSGAYTQAAVHEVATGVQRLTSKIDPNSNPERPTPPPAADRGAG